MIDSDETELLFKGNLFKGGVHFDCWSSWILGFKFHREFGLYYWRVHRRRVGWKGKPGGG